MTAAFAYEEYEFPDGDSVPAEAVEQAELGKVVYLNRPGHTRLRLSPAKAGDLEIPWQRLIEIAENPAVSPHLRDMARQLLDQVSSLVTAAQEETMAELIDEDDEDIEIDSGAIAQRVAAILSGEVATIPHAEIARRHG